MINQGFRDFVYVDIPDTPKRDYRKDQTIFVLSLGRGFKTWLEYWTNDKDAFIRIPNGLSLGTILKYRHQYWRVEFVTSLGWCEARCIKGIDRLGRAIL